MIFESVLSIDIGNHSTKIVIGKYKKNTIIIEQAICIPTPSNCILNGKIIDPIKLKEALHSTLSFQNIKIKKVIFTIESEEMITRQIILPYAPSKQLSQMIEYEVLQKFPSLLKERILQYKKLEDLSIDGIPKSRMILASLPKSFIKDYWELGKNLGLQPLLLDSHFHSICKLFYLDQILIHNQETIAVLDLGHKWIHIYIFYKGILQITKTLSYNENQWIDEIERVFIYHSSTNLGNEIHKIYLIGGKANDIHMKASLEKYFGILVEEMNSIDHIKIASLDSHMDIKRYINAIGAMIRK
ncbi:type IV pilus biogenesis protein PilM [Inediibacterium massiliense]|uniref:type IV pilus biogenesis protein PilM n=1 Tax=Inediibacterium massiliense TaxID=1658111 RepID=UPI0006B52F7F|nr:pilus assembly protein PilM [Inediibacterium massiliense]